MVAESKCVAERRGGEQLEANNQPVSTTKLNSIRFESTASPRAKGEAREPDAHRQRGATFRQSAAQAARERQESSERVGDRMVGRWSEVKWGTRSGWGSGVHPRERGEEARSEGVRVLVVAKKFRNGDGAKEDRKVAG